MKQHNKNAFTLVEMMIVIALLFMLLMFAYLPYAHYQEKLKIRQAIREASQTIL
jgi:prepilin-type N-terminal cleavage/methylation domain-containing protein